MTISTDTLGISEAGRRLALVFGVNHAPISLLSPLNHAAADAEEVAEVLQQYCNFDKSLKISELMSFTTINPFFKIKYW